MTDDRRHALIVLGICAAQVEQDATDQAKLEAELVAMLDKCADFRTRAAVHVELLLMAANALRAVDAEDHRYEDDLRACGASPF